MFSHGYTPSSGNAEKPVERGGGQATSCEEGKEKMGRQGDKAKAGSFIPPVSGAGYAGQKSESASPALSAHEKFLRLSGELKKVS
ncbi:Uncharacterised protein [Bacteroides heparinolyticus]|uniref:Uncharacterized protein n=1 Tax=Prevotella heparinolytica TaxID=28113 RepID=A0A449I0V8_9BACE|nr:Uncharacterised protein [Bacteroides heparinolyticus]